MRYSRRSFLHALAALSAGLSLQAVPLVGEPRSLLVPPARAFPSAAVPPGLDALFDGRPLFARLGYAIEPESSVSRPLPRCPLTPLGASLASQESLAVRAARLDFEALRWVIPPGQPAGLADHLIVETADARPIYTIQVAYPRGGMWLEHTDDVPQIVRVESTIRYLNQGLDP